MQIGDNYQPSTMKDRVAGSTYLSAYSIGSKKDEANGVPRKLVSYRLKTPGMLEIHLGVAELGMLCS